ncbi:hypothetical protein AG1IA_04488 [Rhizoctonia solani AG-1 IA]|uniref:Uncharacterized protein n=1 Tax=Thanatephorus cucumeris (strain AG1-IA) TaxID=983506 RepID=L8WXD9_THACA|nr:hypothetical protein AG1IA_04488 [Rhizoctonia solani AG-1 IA]
MPNTISAYAVIGMSSAFGFRAVRKAIPNNPAAQERIIGATLAVLAIADHYRHSSGSSLGYNLGSFCVEWHNMGEHRGLRIFSSSKLPGLQALGAKRELAPERMNDTVNEDAYISVSKRLAKFDARRASLPFNQKTRRDCFQVATRLLGNVNRLNDIVGHLVRQCRKIWELGFYIYTSTVLKKRTSTNGAMRVSYYGA